MKAEKLRVGTFMGETQKIRSLKGFTLSTTDHSQHMKVPKHEHEYPYISLLLHGLYREESVVSEQDITSGSSLFRPKGFEHKNEIGSHNSFCFNIEIENDPSDTQHYTKSTEYTQFERNNLEVLKIYYAFLNNFSDELLSLTVDENLHLLFQHQHAEMACSRAFWVSKLKKEVRLSPEKKYSIAEVSDSLCLHPNYFVRKFKDKTGHTFGEFLLRQRISKSIDLMLYSSKSLTEIALECGFFDQSHFIRHFKHFFSTTPSHYRQTVKG